MKDDSLSDVDQKMIAAYHKAIVNGALEAAKANGATVHPRIADIKRAIELIDSVGKQEPDPLLAKHEPALNVYAKQIWNEAIEAAAKLFDDHAEYVAATKIRRLKK